MAPSPATATESKRTLEYAAATLEASELARQRKQFKGPEEVVLARSEKWCLEFAGGKYAKLAPAFCKSGKTLAVIYCGDLLRQVEALGGLEADCETPPWRSASSSRTRKRSLKGPPSPQDGDAQLLKAKERATASDRCGGAGQDELPLCEKRELESGVVCFVSVASFVRGIVTPYSHTTLRGTSEGRGPIPRGPFVTRTCPSAPGSRARGEQFVAAEPPREERHELASWARARPARMRYGRLQRRNDGSTHIDRADPCRNANNQTSRAMGTASDNGP